MKIRTDFVTNSSSSSFIVILDRVPETEDELRNILFWDENKQACIPSIQYCDYWMYTDDIAERVFKDIQSENQKFYKYDQSSKKDVEVSIWSEIKNQIETIIYHKAYDKYNRSKKSNDWFLNFIPLPDENLKNDIIEELINDDEVPEYYDSTCKKETGYEMWTWSKQDKTEKEINSIKEIQNKHYEKFYEECEKVADVILRRLKDKYKDQKIFILNYYDGDGADSTILEHGGIFRNIPHIRISNH